MKKQLIIGTLICTMLAGMLTACGDKDQSYWGNGDHSYAQSEAAAKMTWELPTLEDVDPGMSQAHFISAPEYEYNIKGVEEYTISYDLKVDGDSACFAISDGKGEFGRMILVEVYGPEVDADATAADAEAKETIADTDATAGGSYSDVQSTAEKALLYISTSDNGVINERIRTCQMEAASDGIYHVELSCENSSKYAPADTGISQNSAVNNAMLTATVNGQDVARFDLTDPDAEEESTQTANEAPAADEKAETDEMEATNGTTAADEAPVVHETPAGDSEENLLSTTGDPIYNIALGAIGTYKGRSQTYGYIDNVLVKDAAGEVLLEENFEGNSIKNLNSAAESASATAAGSADSTISATSTTSASANSNVPASNTAASADTANIFAPYFTYIDDGWMRVESGFTLTEIKGTPAPIFKREFTVADDEIASATLYMTALGAFEASVNGSKVSPNVLDPGVLDFGDELKYVAYDVTNLLQKSNTRQKSSEIQQSNVLEITLGHGWFDHGQGFPETAKPWGRQLALKGELVIRYENGNTDIIPTDESFKVTYDSPVRFDDIYQGQIYDDNYTNIEKSWMDVQVDQVDEKWISLSVGAKENEPIRPVEELYAQSVTEPEPGVFVYDFGKNISGSLCLDLSGETTLGQSESSIQAITWDSLGVAKGDTVTFRYGETLNMEGMANPDGAAGTIWTQNLLTARATDYLVVGENQSPYINFSFTAHGFRYLEIRGLQAQIPANYLKVSVLSSDLEITGEFESSDTQVQALYDNAVTSIRSNFLDNPTDCNQRDERLGWAGDAQDASHLACYLYDSRRFYEKYLDALVRRQNDNGAFLDTAPSRIGGEGNNCWGDAPLVIAWNLYTMYGDEAILEKYYPAFEKWVDYLVANSDNYIRELKEGGSSYGDHLSEQGTPEALTDTAWCAHSAELTAKMAKVLGDAEGEKKYSVIATQYKEAWRERFVREDGSVEAGILTDESDTAYALGICFGLFEESMMQDAADRLSILADYSGYKFYPGYSGLCYFLPALARYGHADTAYKVLIQDGPGTLMNTLACGMTSMPESLYAYTFNEEGLLDIQGSLNHYAYSSVMTFMYTDVLGIQADEEQPGFKHFYLRPVAYYGNSDETTASIDGTGADAASDTVSVAGASTTGAANALTQTAWDGGFGDAKGSFRTSYGLIEVSRDENGYHCTVPEGCTATVIMPDGSVNEVQSGSYDFSW